MAKALAVRYHETGKPEDVLRVEEIEVAEPQAGEVTVRLIAAPVHPSDLGMIGGTYGRLRELPAIAGREGVGEVVAAGADVSQLKEGDRVRMPEEPGVWAERVTVKAEGLTKIPEGVPDEQAAMAFVNPPTAVVLLKDFGQLHPGNWVIQNAANSAVGVCVIQLAKSRGIHTINIVRDKAKWEERLKAHGADVVVSEEEAFFKDIEALTGGPRPKLGLNSVGGESVIRIIRSMGDGCEVVTFGGMVGDKVRFPTRNLIFNDVVLRGFWMDRWYRTRPKVETAAFQLAVFDYLKKGTLAVPVEQRFPISHGLEAVAAASAGGRTGKILITG